MSRARSTRLASAETAAAEVIGTSLLVGLTVTVAAALSAVLLGLLPGPTPPDAFQLALGLDPQCPWGDGDDVVTLEHRGGEPVHAAAVHLMITASTGSIRIDGTSLDEDGDGDGVLEIGERWRSPGIVLPADAHVQVDLVLDSGAPRIVFTGAGRAATVTCGGGP